ncbi:LysR family transcriptional regulator [uncultured Halopseudomonas sp.]|uniref:LysR family transcriptional regulator n=1 Tax=uncultured Halopseudomonas sp. TaxID=2901193 RepID=UPI0030EE1E9A
MKIQRIDDLAVFLHTVEAGSFSAAARQLNLAPAVASASIKRLEEQLGTRLFERTTRRLRLSEAGERYLPHARAAFHALRDAEQALEADANQQPIDLAVRYGQPEDSSFVALPLAPDNRRVLCASPAYLAQHGSPQNISELSQHNCLCFRLGEAVHDRWRFAAPEHTTLRVRGDRTSDDGDTVRRWALRGQGIAYKSYLDIAQHLASGELVWLLPEVTGEPSPLMLLVINRRRLNPALRQLAGEMAAFCQGL